MSLIVWVRFWGCHRRTFVLLLVNSSNYRIYFKRYHYLVTPVMQRIHNTIRNGVVLQHNQLFNKAGIVEKWLDSTNFQVHEHHAYSPALNTIEHVLI